MTPKDTKVLGGTFDFRVRSDLGHEGRLTRGVREDLG
jgi:hypothetical protein